MHPLFHLPCEVLDLILSRLSQSTLAQLCLINQQSYDLCLPHLYRHVHIKFRKQLGQLAKGLQRSPYLAQVVRKQTQRLTLTCCQSSFQWLISPAQVEWCQQSMPSLTTLTLCDFPILPIERVLPFLTRLTSLETVCFRYCNLVSLHQPESYIPMLPEDHSYTSIYQLPMSYYSYNSPSDITTKGSLASEKTCAVKRLVLDWSDFSSTAIDHLLHSLPALESVSFGANHNRIKDANNIALISLKRHCQHISLLKIALQQIHPSILAMLITHYGPQLLQLDIQCQDGDTLKTVAQHATKVEQLVIHAVGAIQQQEEGKTSVGIDRLGIEGIVQHCGELTHMEIISWGIRDIPSVILRTMAHRRKQQRLEASFIQTDDMLPSSWSEKASLALDKVLLAELRTLFVGV